MLARHNLRKFNRLKTQAEAARKERDYEAALERFEKADELAVSYSDDPRRFQILLPTARILWGMNRYNEAGEKLEIAYNVATSLGEDERGISISELGRLAAHRTVRTAPTKRQAWLLKRESIPRFEASYEMLKNHPHLYYRYENAQHGSLAAALSGERTLALKLILEGLETAFQKPGRPYGEIAAFGVSPGGLVRLAGATALIPLGNCTPLLARFARSKLIN